MSVICAGLTNKGKVGVQRGRKTAGCPSFLPPRGGRRDAPAVRRRRIPPLRFSGKLPARKGRIRLRQFEHPAQPVQKKEPPVRGEHADAVRVPPVSRCRKGAARQGEPADAVRASRSAGAEKAAAPSGTNPSPLWFSAAKQKTPQTPS